MLDFTKDPLKDLRAFVSFHSEALQNASLLLGGQPDLRRTLNAYRDGMGDRAVTGDVDTVWEQDKDVIKLVTLDSRWKECRAAKRALDDKMAVVRWVGLLLTSKFQTN